MALYPELKNNMNTSLAMKNALYYHSPVSARARILI